MPRFATAFLAFFLLQFSAYSQVLDALPAAHSGYSIRLLRAGWNTPSPAYPVVAGSSYVPQVVNGPALRVRRSSDDALQDIGFIAGGNLDQTALLNFIGGRNFLTHSEDLSNPVWSLVGLTVSSNTTAAPNGSLTADVITETAANNEHFIDHNYSSPAASSAYTFSIYVKAVNHTNRNLILRGVFANGASSSYITFDVPGGSVVSTTGGLWTNAAITAAGSGWYLIKGTYTTPAAIPAATDLIFRLQHFETTPPANVYTGNTSISTALWGAQLQPGTVMMGYTPTASNPQLTIPSGYIHTWFDQTGNGRHITQTNQNNQPMIVDQGTLVVTSSGRATVKFNGAGTYTSSSFLTNSSSNLGGNNSTINMVARWNGIGGNGNEDIPFGIGTVGDVRKGRMFHRNGNMQLGWNGNSNNISGTGIIIDTTGNHHMYSAYHSGSSVTISKDGAEFTGTLAQTTLPPATGIGMGQGYNPSELGDVFTGISISEAIIFGSSLNPNERRILNCDQGAYYSQTASLPGVSFYITGTVNAAGCKMATEQVVWNPATLSNAVISANNLTKINTSAWDGGAASFNTVSNNGYLQFRAVDTNKSRLIGLSNTFGGLAVANVQYGIWLQPNATIGVYESGTLLGTFGGYNINDIFRIAVEANTVKYYRNGVLFYSSLTSPVLPLLAHATLYDLGAQVNDVVVANLNNGTFTATAVNAGTGLTYQWKVNGVNTGTNSSVYTNSSLLNGDVVTCSLSLIDCPAGTIQSNSITISAVQPNPSLTFYIKGDVNSAGCKIARENVVWKFTTLNDFDRIQRTGNSITKIAGSGWDAGAASYHTVAAGGYAEFTVPQANRDLAAGLSTSYTGPSYNNIQYCIHLSSAGSIQIYESGTSMGVFGTYLAGDVFRIASETGGIRYYKNNILIYASSTPPALPLLFHAAISDYPASINNVTISNLSSGSFTAVAQNTNFTPSYTWKVNGVTVQTGASSTYSNPAIATGAVVTCELVYGGCLTGFTASNSIQIQNTSPNPGIAFWIEGVASASGCKIAGENVVWRYTSLENSERIQATGNSLTKLTPAGWNAAAMSYNTVSDYGYLEFIASETNTNRVAGLSATYTGNGISNAQHAFYLLNNATFEVYESGIPRGNFGTYAVNDTFRVAVENNIVRYYRNGNLVYTGLPAASLPMQVFAALNETGATITDAKVYNYNNGTFLAHPVNAGATFNYQWKVNGVNVGTNSASYTNATLNSNDIVTCVLSLTGCLNNSYTSNPVKIFQPALSPSTAFYIQVTPNDAGCILAGEEVVWKYTTSDNYDRIQTSGNNLLKVLLSGWNAGAISHNQVVNNSYLEFIASETNKSRIAGLSAGYTGFTTSDVQFGVYLQNNGTFAIYETGVSRGTFGTYAASDTFRVSVESGVVKYYKNGIMFYTSLVVPVLPLYASAVLNETGATVTDAVIYKTTTGIFTSVPVNAGTAPTVAWTLNGAATGITTSSYTNASLVPGNTVGCNMTPGFCATGAVPSNNIRIRLYEPNRSLSFYIEGVVNNSGCSRAGEEVVWKFTSFSDEAKLIKNNNNLTKQLTNGWDQGAASFNTVYNNGYLEFVAQETNKSRVIGISNTYAGPGYTVIQHAFMLQSTGIVSIYESGALRGSYGAYVTGDQFRIAVENGIVKYYRNGTLLYTSTVVPSFPLFAHASLNETGATATQVKIYNYNAGSFKARAREAGLFMNYTWKVNGVTVATGPSNSYTNNNLNIGDQITCTLNLAGCLTGNNYNSNTIDIILAPQLDLDFFIQGNVVQTGCANALEQVKWKLSDLSPSVTAPTYNSLIKNVSNGTWTGGAGSWNTVSDNGYFEFKAVETNKLRAVGLSTNDMNAALNSIQYAFYLQNDGNFRIYESGADRGLFGAYAPNTVFTIAVEAGTVRYYKSGALVYVSGVAPVLPLVVDVSINEVGGTVADAFVSNRNAGSFTANLVNAGTYVWKVNGVTVQTGSSNSYTNTALNNNDVITCSLTSNITGCIPQTITSNYITYVYSRPPAAEFYIRTNPVTGNCFRGREQVQWRKNDLSTQFIAVNGFNDLIKMQGNGVWNCGAASWNTVANNGYFEFTATENNKTRAAGLSTVNTDATLASIQYCFYLLSNGTYSVYELGVNRGSFGAYTPGSVFRIAVENNIVKYYRNGNLVYISQVAPVLPLLADVSMYDTQSTITDPVVSNYHAGSFTAVSVNAGPSPSYQWKLNGTTVQTGLSATYTNTTLIPGDVINCVMTSSNTGCSPFPFYSDSVVIESTTPAGFDFAITGNAATSSCARITEPVKWKLADMSRDIIAVSQNSLLRVQGTGWNGGAASWNKVYEGGYFEFTATETNKPRVAGLSTTSINDDFVTIQYGIYLRSNGTYEIRQSGAAIALSPNVYATGDVFRVAVESNTVRYFRNGTLVYVSLITPVMPLIVDVSTYETGATITNAVVNNLSSGSFTAYSVNAGLNPTYNWKVNGVTFQSGTSATYTNLGLVTGDQVSCEIVSALSGCSSSPALSNIITNQVTGASGTDFYITATATPASCAVAREQVKWKKSDLSDNVTAVGVNSLIKNYDNLLWNGGAASWNKVSNNGFFEFTATETNRTRVAGLSTTNLNADMASIRYGVMLDNTGAYNIYETGIYRNVTGTYSSGDIFRIAVESNIVKYYKNGNLLYTSLLGPTLPLLVDVSIFETGGTITNATITNFHTGVFSAGVINGGTAPNYKWLVNGLQVQNGPSATYTNTTLAQNDVVTCELTPDLAGCNNLSPITSNSILHTAIPPAQSDFYIKGNAVTSSCTMLEEEVKWKRSDLVNVQASVNDLTKFQSDGIWDGGAASWNTVGLNGFFQFTTAENNLAKTAGLSPTNINASNTSISYAFHLLATGEMRIMESGTDRGISMSYAAGDKFRMSVENVAGVNRVRYYKNNILVYTSTLAASVLPMLADVSIYNTGGTINDGLVSNPNNGSFIAGSVNAGTPVYNWKVNGISVQNGPLATYSNGSLSHNDVITCEMTPGLTGCNTVNVASNITTFKGTVVQITSPASVCSPGTIDLTDPSITAGTSPDIVLTYWTNAAATIPLLTPTQVGTGTYYIKGTRQGSCTDVKPVSVTVNPSPTASITSPSGNNQLTCTTGLITLNATASHPFTWDNGTTNPVRNINSAGTYTVTASSANGCSTTTTFTVFQNTAPPVPFINGNTSPICQGATVTLTSLPSIYNNAIRFDGVAQTAELGSWFNYQTFTVEMWVKPGATQSPDATIIDNNFETGGRSWTCKQNGSTANQYQFTCYNTLGTSATATFNLTAAIWQHLTLVKTLTSLDVYINGALAVSSPWNLGIINYDGSEFLRLAAWGGQNRYWNGWMDEVRIFNKDISAARIAADMNVYFPVNTTNLVAQFKMDEPDNSVSIANATGYVTGSVPVLGNPNFLPSGIPITSTFTHSWAPGGSTSASVTFTPTGPVVYQVTSTGPNGCSVTDTADITVSLSGLATITATTPGCENTTPGTITLSASGAVAPYTFFYTINGVPSSAVTAAGNSSVTVNHPATASGTYVYSLQNLTYSNASFCLQAQSGSDSVTIYPEPLITGTIPGSTCGPGTVNLSATTIGTNIQWYAASTGGAALGTAGTFTTPVISATTTFYAQAISAQGCSSSVRTPVIASVDLPGQWLGYTIDWDTPSNWSCNILPTSTTDVTIPTIPIGGNFPVVNSTGISVCRDLTIQAGASVTVNALRSLGIYGNVSNNGSPVWGPGELKFSGSTMQLLNAAASQQAGRISMNNSTTGSALRLMTDIKVDQQVTFTDGVLDLNGRTLTLGTAISNGTFTGQSSVSYINSNGGFTKVFTNTNTNYIWPVGDTTYYTPYSLQLTSGGQSGATIQVKVIPGMQPNLPASIAYLNRYWTVEPSGLNASLNFNAVYIYAGAFEIIGGGPIFPVKYSLTAPVAGWAGCPGSSATVIAGTSGSHNPGTFTLDWQGLTAFSDFTGAGNNAPLPIELLYFEAHQELQQVLVNWATATEINNDYFDVERGRDLYFFSPIGRIAGSGTTSVPRQYSFTDPHPYEGLSYYRLRQTDFDGTSTITAPVAVRFRGESNGPLVIYYDTESGTLLHEWKNDAGVAGAVMYDATGRMVFELKETRIPENWTASHRIPDLQSGIYTVLFTVNGEIYIRKVFAGR